MIDDYITGHYGEDMYYDEDEVRYCPVCGEEAHEFFYNNYTNDIIGCSGCVEPRNSNEIDEI